VDTPEAPVCFRARLSVISVIGSPDPIIVCYSVSRCQELCSAVIEVLSIADEFKMTIMKHITPKPKQITDSTDFFKTRRRNLTDRVLSSLNKEVREYLRSPLLSNIRNFNNILRNITLFTLNRSPVPLLREGSRCKIDFELSKLKKLIIIIIIIIIIINGQPAPKRSCQQFEKQWVNVFLWRVSCSCYVNLRYC